MATLKSTTINGTLLMDTTAFSDGSKPMALSYGRLQCYGTLNINADTDNSKTEYVILTSGHGCSSSIADGLAIGYDSLTWKNNNLIHAGNIGDQSVNYAANSGKLGGFDAGDYYKRYTISIEVGGSADYYYPVYITSSSNKKSLNYLSIWKDLGSKTASYSGNHSNGTSSLFAIYETRTRVWDGNGGYFRTHYVSQEYAKILGHIEPGTSAASGIKVWLRGGGTQYYISASYDVSATIYYERVNVGYSPYDQYMDPIPLSNIDSCNLGKWVSFNYYGNAASSDYASSAGSVHWNNVTNKPNSASWQLVGNYSANDMSDAVYVVQGSGGGTSGNHAMYISVNTIGTPFQLEIPDSNHDYIYKRHYSGGWSSWRKIKAGYADEAGTLSGFSQAGSAGWGYMGGNSNFHFVNGLDTTGGSDCAWFYNGGQLSEQFDGTVFVNEGQYEVVYCQSYSNGTLTLNTHYHANG